MMDWSDSAKTSCAIKTLSVMEMCVQQPLARVRLPRKNWDGQPRIRLQRVTLLCFAALALAQALYIRAIDQIVGIKTQCTIR